MDFTQLKRFVAVVEGGSLGKAAETLNISQPGLSKSIAQLETDFGESLFVRGTKGVTPTAFGKAVYRRAKRVFSEWRQLENERVAILGGLTGHVTIGVARGTGFLSRVIPAASGRLTNSRYAVRLTVVSGVAEELVPALQVGELDFAIAPLEAIVGRPDLVGELLFMDRCGLFVDCSHPLNTGRAVSIEQLVNYCWLYSSDVAIYYRALSLLAHGHGVEPRKTLIDSNSVIYLNSTLLDSDFIGILSTDAVEDAVLAGKLREIVLKPSQSSQIAMSAIERPIGFLRRADTALSEISLALQERIIELCPKMGYAMAPGAKAGKQRRGSAKGT